MKTSSLALCAALATSAFGTAVTAETRCTRDEQQGCLTFQVVGIEHDARLLGKIEGMSAAKQAKTLGMDVFKGMVAGKYEASDDQTYKLHIWMDDSWGNQPLPANRITQVCYTGLESGENVVYKARGLTLAQQGGSAPSIVGVGMPHTTLSANCDGGVGAGWIIPKDVAEHMHYAMICPDGNTYYPFRRGGEDDGIVHSGKEISWYLRQGLEGVISASMW